MIKLKIIKLIFIFFIFSLVQASDFSNSFSSKLNFESIITNTVSPGIMAKKNTNSFSFVHSTVVQFDAYDDVGSDTEQMFANILFKSGVELSFGKFLSKYANTFQRIILHPI